jgi:hypothetical protein
VGVPSTNGGHIQSRRICSRRRVSLPLLDGFAPPPAFAGQGVAPDELFRRPECFHLPLKKAVPTDWGEAIVVATVGETSGLPLLVDTGTPSGLTLFSWAVREVGLKVARTRDVPGYGKVKITGPTTLEVPSTDADRPLTIDIAGATLQERDPLERVNQSAPRRLAGIIGWDILRVCSYRLDMDAGMLSLYAYEIEGKHAPLRAPGALVVPLRDGRDYPFYVEASVPTRDGALTAKFLVDTGANLSSLQHRELRGREPAALGKARLVSGSFAGVERVTSYLLPSLRLADHHIPLVALAVGELGDVPLLGRDVLFRYQMVVDGPNRSLLLLPRPRHKNRVPGITGVTFAEEKSAFRVSELPPDFADLYPGLRVGDTLTSLDGSPVAAGAEGLSSLVLFANRPEGEPVSLRFEGKDGKVKEFRHPQPSAFPGVVRAPGGLLVHFRGGKVTVLDADADSPARKAGLSPGCEVVSIDGRAAGKLSVGDARPGWNRLLLGGEGATTLRWRVKEGGPTKETRLP